MTEKLFYKDSRIREFTAIVETCRETEKNQYEVVLERTAFFPEEGGQYADTGIFLTGQQEIKVLDVQEKDGIVIHYTDRAVDAGMEITGKINYEERFSKMQQHTGEHIVSGIIHRRFGYNNVGFHLGSEEVTMDFDGMLTMEQLREVEREANEAVAANVKIQVLYPTKEELKEISYRSKIEIEGQVRIVRIPGWDTCACCAPHVTQTGEIGIIKLTGAIKYKGGMRISMLCGFRALEDYNRKEESVTAISRKLSAKSEAIVEAVERLEKEIQAGKEKIIRLQEQYIKGILEGVKPSDSCVLLFEEELDPAAMRNFVNQAMEITDGICGVFVGTDEDGYRYVMGTKQQNINAIAKEMNQVFNGRGGGKPPMVQGSLKAAKEVIEEFLKKR
ncbi:MAG: DHHA1 domain-containing protein [Blautia sp.]